MVTRLQKKIDGINISFLGSGHGKETLLFLHGSCMAAQNWLPQLQNKALSETYNLIAVDLPGHGASARASDNPALYQPGPLARLLETFLDDIKGNFILVGLSLGTNIIGEMTAPLPACKGMVLASPCIVNDQHPPAEVITPSEHGHVVVTPNPTDADLRAYVYSHLDNETIAEQYINDYRATDPRFREQLGQFIVAQAWSDEWKNIQKRQLPVCVVFGKKDSLLKTDYLDTFTPLWNEVYKIEGAGHMVNEEQPERFNEMLLAYAQERLR